MCRLQHRLQLDQGQSWVAWCTATGRYWSANGGCCSVWRPETGPTMDPTWYRNLRKPEWTPPNWVFPAMWIPLKIAQSVAVWLVWKSRAEKQELALPLTVFGASLALGNWWNVVFMGRHQMKPSLKWMGAFWLSIAGVIGSFHPFSPLAAALVAPTQLWVTVAAKLNYDIVKLNTGKDGRT
ncbi:hypothetical protein WJX77_010436 [Trebouxia sp. C0004]